MPNCRHNVDNRKQIATNGVWNKVSKLLQTFTVMHNACRKASRANGKGPKSPLRKANCCQHMHTHNLCNVQVYTRAHSPWSCSQYVWVRQQTFGKKTKQNIMQKLWKPSKPFYKSTCSTTPHLSNAALIPWSATPTQSLKCWLPRPQTLILCGTSHK